MRETPQRCNIDAYSLMVMCDRGNIEYKHKLLFVYKRTPRGTFKHKPSHSNCVNITLKALFQNPFTVRDSFNDAETFQHHLVS